MKHMACSCLLALLAGCSSQPSEEETNHLLTLILAQLPEDGRFAVVLPTTALIDTDPEYVKENFAKAGYHINGLVDTLFAVNRRPVRLALKSSPSAGYVIDYDKTYPAYFDGTDPRSGWAALRKEHPDVLCMTRVSLPVIDKGAELVLVYVGSQYAPLAGRGDVVLYQYKGGRLKLLARVMTWIS